VPTQSDPVKLVAGGYYVLAIEDSPDVHLLSADHLGVGLTGKEKVILCFQNHTPATEMQLKFTSEADAAWDDGKSLPFKVVPNDIRCRTYTLDLSAVPPGTAGYGSFACNWRPASRSAAPAASTTSG